MTDPGWTCCCPTDLSSIHVVPIDDTAPHVTAEVCLCEPERRMEDNYTVPVIIHHSFDQRELVEETIGGDS